MTFVLVVGVVAAVYGLIRGGSLDSLAATHFRFLWLLFAGLVVQVGFDLWNPGWLTETGDLVILVLSNLAVAAFLVLNRSLPGMWLAATGLLLNALVITLNQGMPVSDESLELAGLSLSEYGIKHEPLGPNTSLPWIADVIPLPGLKKVLSIGDLFLAAGIGWLVYRRTVDEPEEQEGATPAVASGPPR